MATLQDGFELMAEHLNATVLDRSAPEIDR
jgi:hypothetical protein